MLTIVDYLTFLLCRIHWLVNLQFNIKHWSQMWHGYEKLVLVRVTMNISKDEYILNRLSKIKHKKWELFVISRIVHGLNDSEIEFVCQQPVKHQEKSHPYLTDLFFPQFDLYLEIDEAQHADEQHKESDIQRSQDILDASGLEEFRIEVFESDGSTMRSLADISKDTDAFIEMIKDRKAAQIALDEFEPWDFEMKFSPIPHLERGYISRNTNAVFKYQRDALECFGYLGGHYQRGAWTLADDSSRAVWFPRLYETKDWDNSLSEDGTTIVEKRKDGTSRNSKNKYEEKWKNRIVFARYSDELGAVLYRYVGEFALDHSQSSPTMGIFKLVADEVKTIPASA